MKLTIIDQNNVAHQIEATEGHTLMETIRDAGLEVAAQCGGCCSCATCHVYIDESWTMKLEPVDDDEEAMLELAIDRRDQSRLSCQITISKALEGLTLVLAPGTTI